MGSMSTQVTGKASLGEHRIEARPFSPDPLRFTIVSQSAHQAGRAANRQSRGRRQIADPQPSTLGLTKVGRP
jgi:hypothetical protein